MVYVTDRCVLELRAEGLTITELAPGVDLQRDVLDRAEFPLRVDEGVAPMDPRLFRPEPLGPFLDGARRPSEAATR